MKSLFWIFALLGLVTYGGAPRARTAPASSIGAQRAQQTPRTPATDIVTISEDGTPPPRK